MSQIDREMEQIEHRSRSVTLLSTVGGFVPPLYGELAPWTSLNRTIEHAVDTILTWHERAKTRRQLLMLDDRLLRDIGITRLDARGEADKPFWQA